MIKIDNLKKTYGNNIVAVKNLSIDIPNGEVIGFLGPNGAGKTTTLKIITGILKPDSGRVIIDDYDLGSETIEAKKRIGFIPDSPDVFLRLKAIDYLNFMGNVYDVPVNVRKDRINQYASIFDLSESLNQKIQSFSHGMRQKLVLLGALIHDPSVWILDEPLTGLDPKSSFELKNILKSKAAEGKTIFFSTHILEVAEKFCDKVAIINKGELIFFGTIEEMRNRFKENTSLENMFLELTENS